MIPTLDSESLATTVQSHKLSNQHVNVNRYTACHFPLI